MPKLPVIALDGPSGVGKSTTAKRVAQSLGWSYLDTGGMYRTAALALQRAGLGLEERERLVEFLGGLCIEQRGTAFFLDGVDVSEAIRGPEVGPMASKVATDPAVREVLVDQQRRVGRSGGWVVDGRDIGTVVFPDACCKVFLTASAEVRAERRVKEFQAKGLPADYQQVLEDQKARDLQDTTRAVSPLRKAEDAAELDSGGMTLDEVVDWIVAHHLQHG